jgi:hypothetical protein
VRSSIRINGPPTCILGSCLPIDAIMHRSPSHKGYIEMRTNPGKARGPKNGAEGVKSEAFPPSPPLCWLQRYATTCDEVPHNYPAAVVQSGGIDCIQHPGPTRPNLPTAARE